MQSSWLAVAAGLVAAGCYAGAAHAQADTPSDVDVELVLAVDVSRSMDIEEQQLQRAGYVNAFRHPDVINAIGSGLHGRIAVAYAEWAGLGHADLLVPWTLISSVEEAEGFAAKLEAAPITRWSGTSISGGLMFAAALLESSGYRGMRRVVDISGDGPNNMGAPVAPMRDTVLSRGITINGLPIMLRPSGGYFGIDELDIYYEDCVIGGPGAFVIPVRDSAEFADAIRRKLILEIAGPPPRLFHANQPMGATRVDCMIGERLRQRWMNEYER